MSLTYSEVAEIMKIIDASSLDELVLEVDGAKLVVRRGSAGTASAPPAPAPAPATPPAPGGQDAGKPVAKTAVETPEGNTVCSPMVGTFYRSPSPGEAPFVEVGSTVAAGDPLCLIEVMKLYTTIEAVTPGTVEAILAEDATLVEFDQPLFVIR